VRQKAPRSEPSRHLEAESRTQRHVARQERPPKPAAVKVPPLQPQNQQMHLIKPGGQLSARHSRPGEGNVSETER